MTKKIKDLTLGECNEICAVNICEGDCPLHGKGICHQSFYDYEEADLDQDIEVDD